MRQAKRRSDTVVVAPEAAERVAMPATQLDTVASREVFDALQAISADRRAALLMVSVEGFSYAEAANILGVPAGTLMSRIARGREELRALLDDAQRRRTFRVIEK